MARLINYYNDLSADYSTSKLVPNKLAIELLESAEVYISLRQETLPDISPEYSLTQIEQENKNWWPTHCEVFRQGRGDILVSEYTNNLVYFCADGPFYGRTAVIHREAHWWAMLTQPGVIMAWPIVMFNGEVVYSQWNCFDNVTKEVIARGNETILRRGHRGACYFKSGQLNFFSNVYASDELLHWLRR